MSNKKTERAVAQQRSNFTKRLQMIWNKTFEKWRKELDSLPKLTSKNHING